MGTRDLFILDANVLIDYALTRPGILSLAARHVGTFHVSRIMLREEVHQFDETDCDRRGLKLVDPTIENLDEAGRSRGPLSFHDRICLLMARDNGWTCVTNDKRLRRECESLGIEVLWGLEVMVELVRLNKLAPDDAIKVATSIYKLNPTHITKVIVKRFEDRVNALG